MGILIKKVTPESAYLWPKTIKFEIYNSGLSKKACQGCHISEGPGRISKKIMVVKSVLHQSNTNVVRSLGTFSRSENSSVGWGTGGTAT